MTHPTEQQEQYDPAKALADQILLLIKIHESERREKLDKFYNDLHQFKQPTAHGQARTSSAGLQQFINAMDVIKKMKLSQETNLEVSSLFQKIKERSLADNRLGGLGEQPHERVIGR